MSVKIKFAARSEVGNVRTNNEDNLYCNGIIMSESDRERPFFINGMAESPAIFAVCDGMGGRDCRNIQPEYSALFPIPTKRSAAMQER